MLIIHQSHDSITIYHPNLYISFCNNRQNPAVHQSPIIVLLAIVQRKLSFHQWNSKKCPDKKRTKAYMPVDCAEVLVLPLVLQPASLPPQNKADKEGCDRQHYLPNYPTAKGWPFHGCYIPLPNVVQHCLLIYYHQLYQNSCLGGTMHIKI